MFAGKVTAPSGNASQAVAEPDPEYQGYNPKIHGSYDPTAPYAQYHNRLREQEVGPTAEDIAAADAANLAAGYEAVGTFNRFTGAFQGAEKSADRHNDFNKSTRQLSAFFDVDAAANAHEGT